jgi:hypothetical protein
VLLATSVITSWGTAARSCSAIVRVVSPGNETSTRPACSALAWRPRSVTMK